MWGASWIQVDWEEYVALCEPEYISFGGGCVTFSILLIYFVKLWISLVSIQLYIILNRDGRYGLYLDDTLLDGSLAHCPTFENQPLCSPGTRKGGNVTFDYVGLEVWAVGST
jgi:hypothetical protein